MLIHFFFPEKPSAQIFSNRGASGIDGIIATSIGVAIGSEKPLIAFIGDLAFLPDINSLALAKNLNLPIIFIVLNNSGGGLFHFLPISENRKFMDTFISAKHSLKMEEFARAFGIPYSNPNSLSDYQITLKIALENPTLQIIEVKTNADDNFLFHEQIESYIRKRMSKGKKAGQLYTTASRG